MSNIIYFIESNYLSIVIIVLVTLGLLVVINIKGWDLNVPKPESKLTQQVTVETFNDTNMQEASIEDIKLKSVDNFCRNYLGNASELEKACNELSEANCAQPRCCVFTGTGKCVAGAVTGPIFKTDKDGKMITMDTYYYQGACHGVCHGST